MKVTLVNSTKNPVDTLIFAKSTRLEMSASNFGKVENASLEEKLAHLEYISNTIKSSWEHIGFSFMIEGVSRAFTHQWVRNRVSSHSQQTMRILNVSGFDYVTGPTINTGYREGVYNSIMDTIQKGYDALVKDGVSIEDARGVLPTNICTNVMTTINLRALSDMMASRSSSRTQGEFRDVIDAMYEAVIAEMPWLHMFLRNKKTEAANELESVILSEYEGTEYCNDYIKLIDILRI